LLVAAVVHALWNSVGQVSVYLSWAVALISFTFFLAAC
jgi:hypothetical protein